MSEALTNCRGQKEKEGENGKRRKWRKASQSVERENGEKKSRDKALHLA